MTDRQLPEVGSSRSFFRSVKLVAWSFLGVRSKQGYQDDLSRVNPLHVVFIGIVGTFLLVIGLILLAKWVVAG
jgi:hypothetical protein